MCNRVHSVWGKGVQHGRLAKFAMTTGAILCLVSLSAFAYSKFSGLDGDEAGFCSTYLGDGVFSVVVTNLSDRELKLQEQVKLMRWTTGEEVEGDAAAVVFENAKIPASSQRTIRIDLSEAYDIATLEQELPEGDWYYLVLTNNQFAFGQDWMCSVDFVVKDDAEGIADMANGVQLAENQGVMPDGHTVIPTDPAIGELHEVYYEGILKYETWVWPTVSEKLSSLYGTRSNGITEIHSDHINIVGECGDEIFAVAGGTVLEKGYASTYGNYILLDVGEGITVKYGHLQKITVNAGDCVEQGQKLGTMGASGRATGPNLSFAVYENGEAVNPLAE